MKKLAPSAAAVAILTGFPAAREDYVPPTREEIEARRAARRAELIRSREHALRLKAEREKPIIDAAEAKRQRRRQRNLGNLKERGDAHL